MLVGADCKSVFPTTDCASCLANGEVLEFRTCNEWQETRTQPQQLARRSNGRKGPFMRFVHVLFLRRAAVRTNRCDEPAGAGAYDRTCPKLVDAAVRQMPA